MSIGRKEEKKETTTKANRNRVVNLASKDCVTVIYRYNNNRHRTSYFLNRPNFSVFNLQEVLYFNHHNYISWNVHCIERAREKREKREIHTASEYKRYVPYKIVFHIYVKRLIPNIQSFEDYILVCKRTKKTCWKIKS